MERKPKKNLWPKRRQKTSLGLLFAAIAAPAVVYGVSAAVYAIVAGAGAVVGRRRCRC